MNGTCCAILRRPAVMLFEPETVNFMGVIGVAYDDSVYNSGTAQQKTGIELWTILDTLAFDIKEIYGLSHYVLNLSTVGWIIYPYLVNSAANFKFNFLNPADTDGAYRQTFSGGYTHNKFGSLPNGTNGYANTHLTMNTLSPLDVAAGVYVFSNVTADARHEFGSYDAGIDGISINSRNSGNNAFVSCINQSGSFDTVAVADSLGMSQISRLNNTQFIFSKRGVNTTIARNVSGTISSTQEIYMNALNLGGSPAQYSSRGVCSFYIMKGLNATQLTAMDTAFENFNTSLVRNV